MSQHSPHRPSDREICSKVNEALEAVENDNIAIIDERHNQEAMELCQATSMDDVFDYIKVFLEEIRQIGPWTAFSLPKIAVLQTAVTIQVTEMFSCFPVHGTHPTWGREFI